MCSTTTTSTTEETSTTTTTGIVHDATTSTNIVSSICTEGSLLSFTNNDTAIVTNNQVLIDSITESDNIHPPSSLINTENSQSASTIKTQETDCETPQNPVDASSSASIQVVLVGMNNISKSNSKSVQQKFHDHDSMHSDSIYTSNERNTKSDGDDDDDSKNQHSIVLGTSEDIYDLELGTRIRGKRKNNINTSFEDDIIVSDDDTYDVKLQKRYQQLHVDVASRTPPPDTDFNDGEKKHVDTDLIELQQYFENSLLHGNVHSISLINSDYESTAENENDASIKRSDSDPNHNSNRSYPDSGSLVHMMSSLSDGNEVKDHTINVDKTTDGNHPLSMECALAKNEFYDRKVDKPSERRTQPIIPIMMILSIFVVIVVSLVLAQYR